MMNYEYPLSKSRLQEEQEELMLKLALSMYLERQNASLRTAMAGCPDLPDGVKDAEHAVDRAMRKRHWKDITQKTWQASAKVISRAAVVFLTFCIFLTTAFAVSEPVRDAIYKILFSREDRYTLVQVNPSVSHAFIDAELYTWDHCFAPTYLPEGYELAACDDMGNLMVVTYEKGDKYIDFTQTPANAQSSIHVDSENAQVTHSIKIGSSEGIYNLKDEETSIVWQIGGCLLSILSNEDTEEVIKVAEEIRLLR